MRLTIINSNSQGNGYILENDSEALLIECGVHFDKIKKALGFKLSKVVGCLISHEHGDHCKSVKDVLAAGINVYASYGTHGAMKTEGHHRARFLHLDSVMAIGNFKVKSFLVKHDAAEPTGFLINHPETGVVLFLTDSYYSEYKFNGLNNVIIEANYCQSIIDKRVQDGANPKFLRDRVIESHMSLATCKETLAANDLSGVNNIVLIHLSDGNSDANRFQSEVQQVTGKRVYVAEANMVIENFHKQPF
ncbi:MAG: MBL fold metallo-hydrolase [Flavisolibacter sp.]|jgi:phosphoribosyl 1,2-cyclic phosphodiesterase